MIQVDVRFRPRRQEDRTVELPTDATAADLLRAVGEPSHVTVVVRGKTPIADDEILTNGEELLLLSAASGG